MKLTIDTARDNPRLIRAAIAMVLSALDNGDALPAAVPAGLIRTDNEAQSAGFGGNGGSAAPPPPPVAPSSAGSIAPPPPPVPSAAPPAPPAGAPSATDRDSEGLPWDSRIHSSSHAKIANGTWKLAKGMSLQPARVEAVKAELRALMALPAGATGYAPAAPPPITLAPASPPNLAIAPPPPPPVAEADPATFPEFMAWIAGLIGAAKWSHPQTTQALATLGLPSAVGLSSRPDLIPSAVQVIKSMLPA